MRGLHDARRRQADQLLPGAGRGLSGAKKITTVEGLAAPDGTLSPVQAAFIQHDGFQCGFCTSGQLMSASALLTEPVGSEDSDVREAMSGNLCRCGAYNGIVAAVQDARKGNSHASV